jgi:type IV pilus assembly protein PilO
MDLLAQFRAINPSDPGLMPPVAKALCLLALTALLIAAAWLFDWSDQMERVSASEAAEAALKSEYKTKAAQAVNLAAYERQYKEVDVTFGAMLRQLPNRQQVESLLVQINQAGLQRGLQFDLIKPGVETLREFYAELPIQIKVTGAYHDLGGFASDVAHLSRIVTLSDITIAPQKEGALGMDAVARTFRYLDEDESLAQRKAQKAARDRK